MMHRSRYISCVYPDNAHMIELMNIQTDSSEHNWWGCSCSAALVFPLRKSNSIYLFAPLTSFCGCQETICWSSLLREQRSPCGLDWNVEKPSLVQGMEKLSWTECLLNHCRVLSIRGKADFWNTFLDLTWVTITKNEEEGKKPKSRQEEVILLKALLDINIYFSVENAALNFIPITFKPTSKAECVWL